MAAYILELPDDSLDGIIIWMFLLLAFFCVLLPIYELARRNPKFKHVYFTRNLDNSPSSFQLPNQFFSGFIEVFKIPQEEILSKLGIDALQYLRFLAMCFRIILALFVLMFGILIPIHYYAGAAIDVGGQLVNITNADMGLKLARDSLNSISIVNIKDGSPLLWIHLVFAYIVTGWTAYNLYWSYRDYTICYTKHMSSTSIHTASESLRNRTVMVKNMLPETMSILRTWLDSLKLGEIDSITMNTHGNQELYKLVEKRNRVIHLLEVAYMNWARSIYCHINKKQLTSIGPSINVLLHHQKIEDAFKDTYFLKQRPIFLGASLGTDAISHLKQQEEEMTSRIEALRATDSGTPIYSPFSFLGPRLSCFVTFKTRRASELAKQVLLTSDMSFHSMYMLTAPELDTVLWGNLGLSLTERNLRKFSITALGLVFALFWVIPTSLVSSLTDLPKLSDNPAFAGYIEYLSARPFLYTLVGQVGPPLIITIANSCAPYILEYLTSFQGLDSTIDIDRALLGKYFNFLLLNVQFVFIIFTSAWSTSFNIFSNPIGWSEAISVSIPSGGTFFINLLILNTILLPITLLRPLEWAYFYFSRWFRTTPRDYYKLGLATSPLRYGYMFPIQILLFCTVICYSVINPLILLPGVIYFGAAWMVYKNQLIYVYVKEVESYGAFWKMAYTRSLMGLYAFQFVTAGLLSAKRANYQAILCGLLVPCTVIFQILCSSIFSRHLKYLPLDQCDDQPFPTAAPGQKSLSYQSPAFSKRLRTVWVPEYIAHLVTPEIDAAFSESAKKSVSQRGLIPIFQI